MRKAGAGILDLNYIPVTDIKGISSAREKLFASLDIRTVDDLLNYYPRSYQNRGTVKDVFECADGELVSVILEVITPLMSARVKASAGKRMQTVQHIMASDLTGNVKVVFFNREFLKNTFTPGKKFRFYGIVNKSGKVVQMISPEFEPYYSNVALPPFVPVYSLTAGLTQKLIGACVGYCLDKYRELIKETLPEDVIPRHNLCSRFTALKHIHYPENSEKLEAARRRLAFEELYTFFLKTMRLGNKETTGKAYRIAYPDMKAFTSRLPYTLTSAQKHAIHDILMDISGTDKPESFSAGNEFIAPSRRLVQGDVGCGKTMVACAVIYAAAKSGYQSAFMAPTGILARQHYEELSVFLANFGIKCVLLTGGMRVTEKRKVIELIASGEADVVIGTHALIEENIVFKKLAMVVTDEQHRFGVMQRRALEGKASFDEAKPHVVVMSATPIPRTLAMIMYCDLDVSIIDKMPAGRIPVETYAVGESKRSRVYKFISDLVSAGKQAYIVCPLAENNEDEEITSKMELKSAREYCEFLKSTELGKYRVAYIHGKMKQAEKDDIMQRFADGDIDILVSTTVIEVGVNVPNSCVMLVENCERFGLSQLHQLRGRVGRGNDKAYCILMSPLTEKAKSDSDFKKRIDTICKSNSGFTVAEKDLELRGPGEFFGKRQSGEFRFRIANIVSDMELVNAAKLEASKIFTTETENKIYY